MNPGRPLINSSMHGVTDDNVARAPRFEDIAGQFAQLTSGRVPVAHNAPFEQCFPAEECERAGIDASFTTTA